MGHVPVTMNGRQQMKFTSYNEPQKAAQLLESHRKEAVDVNLGDLRIDAGGIQWIKREQIFTLEAAFQPRTFEGQLGDRHSLIQDLIEAINRAGLERIDPIRIWWSGKAWFVVDGHHRLNAIDRVNSYRLKNKGQPIREIPVTIIDGGWSEVCKAASAENGKAHLAMTSKQRSQWAWRVAVLHWSKTIPERFIMAEFAIPLHVHVNTLSNMKAIWRQILDKFREEHGRSPDPSKDASWVHEIAALQWPRQATEYAKGLANEDTIRDDAWRAEAVMKTAERLIRALGKEAFSSPGKAEITADALLVASSRFVQLALGAEEFRYAIQSTLSEISEEAGWEHDEYGFRTGEHSDF